MSMHIHVADACAYYRIENGTFETTYKWILSWLSTGAHLSCLKTISAENANDKLYVVVLKHSSKYAAFSFSQCNKKIRTKSESNTKKNNLNKVFVGLSISWDFDALDMAKNAFKIKIKMRYKKPKRLILLAYFIPLTFWLLVIRSLNHK